jgi:hypothetical protein
MYACIPEIGSGFFEGVCPPTNVTANFCDPPPPHNTKDPEPHCQGSSPKRVTSRANVDDDLV